MPPDCMAENLRSELTFLRKMYTASQEHGENLRLSMTDESHKVNLPPSLN